MRACSRNPHDAWPSRAPLRASKHTRVPVYEPAGERNELT